MSILPISRSSYFSNYSKAEKYLLGALTVCCIAYIAISSTAHLRNLPLWKIRLAHSVTALLLCTTSVFVVYKCITKKSKKPALPPEPIPSVKSSAKKTREVVLAHLPSKPAQQNSLFFLLPDDLFYLIFSHLGSLKEVANKSLVCRKFYNLTHTPLAWKLLLEHLFPKNTFNLTDSPISFLVNLSTECDEIEDALSSETIKALGGTNQIYLLPTTDFFANMVITSNFALHFTSKYSDAAQVFSNAPVVRFRDHAGTLFVFAHFYEMADGKRVKSHFLMIGQFDPKEPTIESSPNEKPDTTWYDDCFADHWQADFLSNKNYLMWWQNFFAGKVCSLDALFESINVKNTIFKPNRFVQISNYVKNDAKIFSLNV